MAAYLDLDPADAARVSGDPRSGYALEISATAKQTAQQRYAPVFRFADERLCSRVAEELNRVGSLDLPVDGWRVRYWFEEDEAPELEETAAMDEAAPEVEEAVEDEDTQDEEAVEATDAEDQPDAEPTAGAPATPDAAEMRAKFDALGIAIRAGVSPETAAAALGLTGLEFTGAIPVSLRPPEQVQAEITAIKETP
jgi:hypothetical protein